MQIIKHRVNSLQELQNLDTKFGVEIDIRTRGDRIILSHDPFTEGPELEDFLDLYQHGVLILNVKEDGLEREILEHEAFSRIEYFFLDQPFPTLRKSILQSFSSAMRTSEFENLPSVNLIPSWLWIDNFTGDWSDLPRQIAFCQERGIKSCLVSPELQSRSVGEIGEIQRFGLDELDAVCTKFPERWLIG